MFDEVRRMSKRQLYFQVLNFGMIIFSVPSWRPHAALRGLSRRTAGADDLEGAYVRHRERVADRGGAERQHGAGFCAGRPALFDE